MLETMPKTRAVVVIELPTRNRSSSRSYQLIVHDCPNLAEALAAGDGPVSFSTVADPMHFVARFNVQEPLSGLPRHLRPNFDSFPQRAQGYLVPDAARVRQLRDRLTAGGRPVIGLTWFSRNPKVGRFKSARLQDFAALLKQPGYRFVDLQYGDTAAERAAVEHELGVRVERLDDIDNTNDIDGLAALIAACDVVLTVSSMTAHLAGAVGARTWVMMPIGRGHLWYWFMDQPKSPWYPRVEVRRQQEGQAWSDLVEATAPEIAAALRP